MCFRKLYLNIEFIFNTTHASNTINPLINGILFLSIEVKVKIMKIDSKEKVVIEACCADWYPSYRDLFKKFSLTAVSCCPFQLPALSVLQT